MKFCKYNYYNGRKYLASRDYSRLNFEQLKTKTC